MKPLLCLLSLLLLVSCRSTSLTPIDTGADPAWQGGKSYDVMVALFSYDPELRMRFEQEMANALREQGVNAVASYTRVQSASYLNLNTFSQLLSVNPNLAIYFVQATTVSKKQANSNPSDSPLFAELLNSEDWKTTFDARMESALYVSGQDNAVWWNRTRLRATEDDIEQISERFVASEMKSLKKSDTIKRLRK